LADRLRAAGYTAKLAGVKNPGATLIEPVPPRLGTVVDLHAPPWSQR
jgi:hypothetical protein